MDASPGLDLPKRAERLVTIQLRILGLRLQEESKQSRYKLSYYLPLKTGIDALQQTMQRRLETR